MYKLVCKGLTKTSKSLTTYTNFYRKIIQQNSCISQTKSPRQKTPSPANNEEPCDEILEKNDRQVKQKGSSSSIFGKRKHMKLFRPVPQRSHFSMMGTSSKKSFYSSNSEGNTTRNYSRKNNYHLNGIKQCNKIKNKYKKSYPKSLAYNPHPFKSNSSELVQSFVHPRTDEPSQLGLGAISTKKDPIQNSGNAKNSFESVSHHPNKDKKKLKIVYPTISMKYKTSARSKRYSFFAQEGKRSCATVPLVGKKREKTLRSISSDIISPPPFFNKLKKIVTYNMGEQYQRAAKFEKPSRLITVHPALKRASCQNKMSIKKKYNQLLLKHSKSAPMVMRNSTNENRTLQENEPSYQISNIQLDDPLEKEPTILIHPVMNNEPQNNFKSALRYTKSIVHDKNELFDIDDICLKTKEKYYLSKGFEPMPKRKLPSASEVETIRQLEHSQKTQENQPHPSRKQETKATPKKTKDSVGKVSPIRPAVATKSLVDYLNVWHQLPDETSANKINSKNKPKVASKLKTTAPITKEREQLSRSTSREVKLKTGICKESNGVIQDGPKRIRIMLNLEKQTENLTKEIFESEPLKKNDDSSSKETLASKTTPIEPLPPQKILSEEFINKKSGFYNDVYKNKTTNTNKPVKNVKLPEKLVEVAKAKKDNIQPKVLNRNLKGAKTIEVGEATDQKNIITKISKIEDKSNGSKLKKQQVDEENRAKAKWKYLKDQMRRIYLVKNIEGVPIAKKGQSQNAHKADASDKQKSNEDIPPKEIREPHTQPNPKVNAKTEYSKIKDQLLKYEVQERLDKSKEIKINKNLKEPFEVIPKKPLMLEMYDKKALSSPITQRPSIRKEKPQEDNKNEKNKPKSPVRLPPHKEITKKKLEKTTFTQKSTNLENQKMKSKKQTIPDTSAAMLPVKGKDKERNILREQGYKPTYLDFVLKKVKDDVFLDLDLDSKVRKVPTESSIAKEKDIEDTNKVNMQPLLTQSMNLREIIPKIEITNESSQKEKITFNYKKTFYNVNLHKGINEKISEEFEKLQENLQQMKSTKLGPLIDYKKISSNEIVDEKLNNILNTQNITYYQRSTNKGLPENELINFEMQSEKSGEQQRKKVEQAVVPVFKESNHSVNKLGETETNTESMKSVKKDDKVIKNTIKQNDKLNRAVFSNKNVENLHSSGIIYTNIKGSKSDISISYKNLPSRIVEKYTNGPNLEESKSKTPNQRKKKLQFKSGTIQNLPNQTGEQKRNLMSNVAEKNLAPSDQNTKVRKIDKNNFKLQFVASKQAASENTVDLDFKNKILDFGLFKDSSIDCKKTKEESFQITEDVCENLEHSSNMEVNFNSLKKFEEEKIMYSIKSKSRTEMIESIIKTDADAALNTEKKEYKLFNMSTQNLGKGTHAKSTNFGTEKIPVRHKQHDEFNDEKQYSKVDYRNCLHKKTDLNRNNLRNFSEISTSPKSNSNYRLLFDNIDRHLAKKISTDMLTYTAINRPGTATNLDSIEIRDKGKSHQRSRLTNFEKEMQEFYIPINEEQVLKSEIISLRPKTANKNIKRTFRHAMRDGVDFQKQDIQLILPEPNVRSNFNQASSKLRSQSPKRTNFDIADFMNGNISSQKIRLSSGEPSLKTGFSQTETVKIRNLDTKKIPASNLKNGCRPQTVKENRKVYKVSDVSDSGFLSKNNDLRPKSARVWHRDKNCVNNETKNSPTILKQEETWRKKEICPERFFKKQKSREEDVENKRKGRPDIRNDSGGVVIKLEKREKNKSTLFTTKNDITTKNDTTTKANKPKNIIYSKNKDRVDTPATDDSYWGYVNQIVVNVIIPKSNHALNDYFDQKPNDIENEKFHSSGSNKFFDTNLKKLEEGNKKISAPKSGGSCSYTDNNGEEINLVSPKTEAQLPSFDKVSINEECSYEYTEDVNLGNSIALNKDNLDIKNKESRFMGENMAKPMEYIDNNMKFDVRNNSYIFPCVRRQKSLEKFAPVNMLSDDVTLNTIDLSNMQKIPEILITEKVFQNHLDQQQVVTVVPENFKHEKLPSKSQDDVCSVRDVLEEFRCVLENLLRKKNCTVNQVASDRMNPAPTNNIKIILDALNDCKLLKNIKEKTETDAKKPEDPFNNDFNT